MAESALEGSKVRFRMHDHERRHHGQRHEKVRPRKVDLGSVCKSVEYLQEPAGFHLTKIRGKIGLIGVRFARSRLSGQTPKLQFRLGI
jgi:hypothetical protein